MRPTVFFARADGIPLRLLYLFASAGKACSASITGGRESLIKGDGPASSGCQWPRPVAFGEMAGTEKMPNEEGWRSGTKHNHTKTDIVVTVRRMIVVTIDGTRVVLIVVPRAATQVRRSEPHSLPLPRQHNRPARNVKNPKKNSMRLTAQKGLVLRTCARAHRPRKVIRKKGDETQPHENRD